MVADVRRLALAAAEAEYQEAGLLDDTPHATAGLKVVQALLRCSDPQEGIGCDQWNDLVPDPTVGKALVISA